MLKPESGTVEFPIGGYTVTCFVNDDNWNQNSFIVTESRSGEKTVIDPGGNAERIIQSVLEGGGTLKRILLTHAHFDHVGAASELSSHFGIPCRLHAKDVRLLMHAPMYALRFANKTIPAVTSFEPFDEPGPIGNADDVNAIHTPGHTQGSTCYLFPGFVFTGDTILLGHIGRTDLPGGDSTMIGRSIDRLLADLDENTILFPGHGKRWTVSEARIWWKSLKGNPPPFDGSDAEPDRNGG